MIELNLIPSNHPFLIAFLPNINPPIKKAIMVEMVKNTFKVVGDNQSIYCKKVKIKVEIKNMEKLKPREIPIFFK